jgi:transcriptional regulator with PAS, ATPase and Fis domain
MPTSLTWEVDHATTEAIGACLRCAHPVLHAAALRVLQSAFRASGGNAVHAAMSLAVSHRTLMRWVGEYEDVRTALEEARS